MMCPQVEDPGGDLQIWRVAANILNKSSRTADNWWSSSLGIGRRVKEGNGEISVIFVKNYFFMLLHKFNLHNLIYDSLKFQTFVTDVQSLIRPHVNLYAI